MQSSLVRSASGNHITTPMQIALAIVLAASTLLLAMARTPEPAYAVGCTAPNCDGYNPNSMGCDAIGTTLDSRTATGSHVVELRYSSTCATTWARNTNLNASGQNLQAVFNRINPTKNDNVSGYTSSGQRVYTLQWNRVAGSTSRACGLGDIAPPNICTGYR